MGVCKYCNKEIFGTHHNKLIAHQRFCKLNPNLQKNLDSVKRGSERGIKVSAANSHTKALIRNQKHLHVRKCNKCGNEYSFECSDSNFQKGNFWHYCSRSCANSRVFNEETKNKISIAVSKYLKSEAGKNFFERRYKYSVKGSKKCICEQCGNSFDIIPKENGKYPSGRFCSNKCREKSRFQHLSKNAKLHNTGGYKPHGGKGKRGWYKGYWCDSSWELAYVIYNIEHDIKFKRNTKGFEYNFKGIKRQYHPDFILDDGSYVEIKGWYDDKTLIKHSTFRSLGYTLKVIDKDSIGIYLDYVIQKYGKKYIDLYE